MKSADRRNSRLRSIGFVKGSVDGPFDCGPSSKQASIPNPIPRGFLLRQQTSRYSANFGPEYRDEVLCANLRKAEIGFELLIATSPRKLELRTRGVELASASDYVVNLKEF
jgi:hypothetical protein